MFPYPFSYMATAESGLAQLDNDFYMDFDGVDDYVQTPINPAIDITGAMSVSLWMKDTYASNYNVMVSKDDGTGARSWRIAAYSHWSGNNGIFCIANGASTYCVDCATTILDGNWHHLVFTYEPSVALKAYRDGVLDGTNNTSIPASMDNESFVPITLGMTNNPPAIAGWPYRGDLDEVAIFNYKLEASDALDIYNATEPGKCADLSSMSTPPVAWYRMGD